MLPLDAEWDDSAMSSNRLRVLLVDDHEVVRDGVKSLINANDDLIVVAEAASVQEAIDQALRTKPNVVVMTSALRTEAALKPPARFEPSSRKPRC